MIRNGAAEEDLRQKHWQPRVHSKAWIDTFPLRRWAPQKQIPCRRANGKAEHAGPVLLECVAHVGFHVADDGYVQHGRGWSGTGFVPMANLPDSDEDEDAEEAEKYNHCVLLL